MNTVELIEIVGDGTEFAGVAVIVGGIVAAAVRAVIGPRTASARYEGVRRDIGRAILLGLEVLVAADIIRTVATVPTMSGVLVLALIVLIRTFLSWTLALELNGRWPWQRESPPLPAESQKELEERRHSAPPPRR